MTSSRDSIGDDARRYDGTVYKEVAGKPPVINLSYYKPTNKDGRPFMPVEFAVAAYRFGHSLIRPFYVLNDSGSRRHLRTGRRPQPQWRPTHTVRLGHGVEEHPSGHPNFPARKPRKIDTKLSIPLSALPGSAVPPPDPTINLAVRNTLRGKSVGLPSGQQVAKAMRITALSNSTLGLSNDSGWGGEAPLWYYILKEAELRRTTVNGSGRWAAGSWLRPSSGSCSGTRIHTCIWTRPGSPPHPLRRQPANSIL